MLNQLLRKARELACENNWGPEAIEVNQQILNLDRAVVESFTRLAKCFKEKHDFERANKMYERALELDPNNLVAKNNLSSRSKARTNDMKAQRSTGEPTLDDLHCKGRILFFDQDDKELIEIGKKLGELLLKATIIPQQVGELCQYVVSAHLNLNDVTSAIEWIKDMPSGIKGLDSLKHKLYLLEEEQRGVQIDQITDTYLLNNLAKLHRELKAYTKAKLIYLKSLNIENNDEKKIYSLNGLGGVCKDARWYDDGIEYYNIANNIKLNAFSYTGIGGIYRALGLLSLAEKSFEDALYIDYSHNYAHMGLGAVLFDQCNYEEGKVHFELAGNQVYYLFNLYYEYERNNLTEKAIECLNVILMKDPLNNKARSLYHKYNEMPF